MLKLIEDNRKAFMFSNYIFLVLYGGITFPTIYSSDLIFISTMIVSYVYLSVIFCGLFDRNPVVVFSLAFLFNLVGLSLRVILEWGEYSMTRSLNILTVGFHLIIVPLFILLIYLIWPKIKVKTKTQF